MRSISIRAICRAAGLSFLPLIGLVAAPAVQAQSLTLGTSLAASAPSSGSAIVSAAGTSVSGAAAFSGGAGASTSSYSSVNEYNASTITLLKGSSVTSLTADENSQVIVNGGNVGTLTTVLPTTNPNAAGFSITSGTVGSINHNNRGTGTISGGTIGAVNLDGYGNYPFGTNPLNLGISGGTIGDISVTESLQGGNVLITGGDIKSLTENGGNVSMSGGRIGSLTLGIEPSGSTGSVTTTNAVISGGHVTTLLTSGGTYPPPYSPLYPISDCIIQGGTFDNLVASNHGGYDIYGSGLQLTSANYVTGTLLDGESIDALFTNLSTIPFGSTGFLNLHNSTPAVPEASTTISFGLLLTLGLGGIALAKRKKSATV